MLKGWFLWFIICWVIILLSLFSIGGFFMFRKFFKKLPKQDGKSALDWEEYYLNKTLDLWGSEEIELLTDLVSPVPALFRDVAKQKIASKIGELALKEEATKINQDLIIRGYIISTPKRDYKYLKKKLSEKQIELTPYEHLFN